MKSLMLIAILVTLIPLAGIGKTQDLEWMIEVQKSLPGGGSIRGTGYLVQIGSDFFVRTASHVTLGSNEVSLRSINGQILPVIKDQGVVDNMNDDQLIKIVNPSLQPLAMYSKEVSNFVVPGFLYRKLEEEKTRMDVERGIHPSFYILPPWTKKRSREPLKKSIFEDRNSLFYNPQLIQKGMDGNTVHSAVAVLPGESGSPLFRTVPVGFGVKDLLGKNIDCNLKNSSGYGAIVYGHAQNYLRYFNQGVFSTPDQAKGLVSALLQGKRGSINPVIWKWKDGNSYRFIQDGKDAVSEANFTQGFGGDGTSGNGGDGTSGNGGNATSGNGGSSQSSQNLRHGMNFNGESVIAFEINFKGKTHIIYANWNSYRYLSEWQTKENFSMRPIYLKEGLSSLIRRKILQSADNEVFSDPLSYSTELCKIDESKLYEGKLLIQIRGLSPLNIDLDDPNVDFVHSLTMDNMHEKVNVDLRGLFSIDISEINGERVLGMSSFDYFSERVFITIGSKSRQDFKLPCRVFPNL